ncbi:hypothetical protein EVAR_44463_1 [Eumeta japonica]|uniref:Uncharacterized protein n=1 Tax=Eumeta variegata TaxID=151549 RepID=A0A4C1WJ96_EUMVA|nr:hypothetical protein EVAR_44463_1 [Eumeta japonica]
MTPKHYLKFGFYNPGSLAKNHNEFILTVTQHSLDILAINASWLQPNKERRAPSLPGFSLHSAPRPPSVRRPRRWSRFLCQKGIRVMMCEHPVCVPVEQM